MQIRQSRKSGNPELHSEDSEQNSYLHNKYIELIMSFQCI